MNAQKKNRGYTRKVCCPTTPRRKNSPACCLPACCPALHALSQYMSRRVRATRLGRLDRNRRMGEGREMHRIGRKGGVVVAEVRCHSHKRHVSQEIGVICIHFKCCSAGKANLPCLVHAKMPCCQNVLPKCHQKCPKTWQKCHCLTTAMPCLTNLSKTKVQNMPNHAFVIGPKCSIMS